MVVNFMRTPHRTPSNRPRDNFHVALRDSRTAPDLRRDVVQVPFREDCWTEEATSTLVDAWGRRYLELNRGNLRQKDWQEVADAVNASRTYEEDSPHRRSVKHQNKIAPSATPPLQSSQSTQPLLSLPSPPMAVPLSYRKPLTSAMVTPVILPQKRPLPSPAVDESYFRRNYSAMAAAAAAAEDEADAEEDDGESEGEEAEGSEGRAVEEEDEGEEGMTRLAKAIERFGEIYEKVENMKQRQMVELEKQRMQFAKDLEVQRMRLFMDTQVQLEKLKQAKRSGSSGGMVARSSVLS
ncbi:hypothetical protein DH2020_032731 [Rehmannia glutinosa]|uniref:Myb/SANT-like DNA-binding domain-containing protein n=1 Tax=Rehmannia glutinosa TaxID=99300 RepID=A0ABR0VEA7_REHGL